MEIIPSAAFYLSDRMPSIKLYPTEIFVRTPCDSRATRDKVASFRLNEKCVY